MNVRGFSIVAAAIILTTASAAQLPDISWTCPMHPDVLEPKKGACNICGMDLEPVRLVLLYTCPVHAVIEQSKPGKCRICARDLVQKTAALTFTCARNRDISQLEPGKCPDGSATIPRYTARAHGDHNPKHGGIFFMAPDNWHHLEGAYPAAGRFRVYVYDDYSKPLSLAQARKVRGRVVTKETFDPKTGTTRELASTPLVLARNGAFFEARLDPLPLPAKLTAKISFSSDDKESRFDFAFPTYSRDSSAQSAPAVAPPVSTGALARQAPDGLIDALKARSAEVESLLKSGTLGGVYVPALQAKDLALEIQATQSSANQDAVEASVKQIVLAAYQLDNYGDLGDGEKAAEASLSMRAAIAQLDSLVSGQR
jgi:Heavy metal binding domain